MKGEEARPRRHGGSRWARRAVFAAGLCAILSACAAQDPVRTKQVESSSGAISTVVPEAWTAGATFRLTKPVGEGLHVRDGKAERMTVYASLTQLEDFLGDNPLRRSLYTFQHIQTALGEMELPHLSDRCTREALRPVEGSGFYGRAHVMRDCQGQFAHEIRAILVDAGRTTVVWLTVRGEDPADLMKVVSTALDNFEIDREAVPLSVAVSTETGG